MILEILGLCPKARFPRLQYNLVPLIVNVTDINDETPVFTENRYMFEVAEGLANAFVGQVKAFDR